MSDCGGKLQVWRCPNCGRILARQAIESGIVEVKCACNQVATLQIITAEPPPVSSVVELNGT